MRQCRVPLLAVLLLTATSAALAATERPLDETVKQLQGFWEYSDEEVSIGGRIYRGWGRPHDSVQFDVRGFDWFVARLGCDDRWGGTGALIVATDGEHVGRYPVKKGQKATLLRIRLTGKQTMDLTQDRLVVLGEPKLIKGAIPGAPGDAPPPVAGSAGATYMLSIDPQAVQKLAQELRKSLDGDPALKGKSVQTAVASFLLIPGIPGYVLDKAVADNVREDLSSALLNVQPRAFRLVERGQLDKVLKELGLPQTGLVDSATAIKLGKMVQAQAVLIGSVSDRGPGSSVVINARLINTATGECNVAAQVIMKRFVPQEPEAVAADSTEDPEQGSPFGDILGGVLGDALRDRLERTR
jgi:hypothetical protein